MVEVSKNKGLKGKPLYQYSKVRLFTLKPRDIDGGKPHSPNEVLLTYTWNDGWRRIYPAEEDSWSL